MIAWFPWLWVWLTMWLWQFVDNNASVSALEITNHHYSNSSKLPIVYVYTVVPVMCSRGLPEYLKISLEQALLSQPDCDVIIASNFAECPNLLKLVENIPNIVLVDTVELTTARVKEFSKLAMDVFQTDNRGELWITSALRFFLMEEIMIKMNYTEMLHVEGDNMLYGRITSILPILRQSYQGIAATPLFANKVFITASVFWISDLASIQRFNHYLYDVALRNATYTAYLKWIRKYACCKRGGIDPDENGNGIKPFAVNEMSMLGYYHVLHPNEFKGFPVVPRQEFNLNKWVVNMSDFGPDGGKVGAATGDAIWDPNSWGQYHGGTSHKRGRDKGFKDVDHVVGQALRTTGCNISMECSPQSNEDILYPLNNTPFYVTNKWIHRCLTAPYVICNGGKFTRLWNLHVHSKHTHNYMSQACDCSTAISFMSIRSSVDAFNFTNVPHNSTKLPVVYVYIVVPAVCSYGLSDYIKVSLEQALLTQPDCEVVLASNFGDCPTLAPVVNQIPNIVLIDTVAVESDRTRKFGQLAKDIFQSDRFAELWITSALRFFIMEDIMKTMKYQEMFHVEGDNLLYGRLTSLLSVLRQGYKGLAATPLTANRSFITASVFWIASLEALQRFNSYLFALASNKSSFQMYLNWLRPFGCCKAGGIDPDERGNGIKPFTVNEMSMLAFYNKLHPHEFLLLPVVPHQTFVLNRWVCNMSDFGPGGRQVGPETNDGIWDPNSWGQYLGGTSRRHGNDKGFRDGSHIIGQAIGTTRCQMAMACSAQSNDDIVYENGNTPYYVVNRWVHKCLTAPYVKCADGPYTRLWNLHVHGKQTHKFMSTACDCATAHSPDHAKWAQIP